MDPRDLHERIDKMQCQDVKGFLKDLARYFYLDEGVLNRDKEIDGADLVEYVSQLMDEYYVLDDRPYSCPECGGSSEYLGGLDDKHWVICANCSAQSGLYPTRSEANKAWARRATKECS